MKSVKDGEMMLDDKAKVLEEKWKNLDDAKATLILNHLDFIREHCGLVVDGMRDYSYSFRNSSTCSSFKEEVERGGSPKRDLSLGAMVECKQEDNKGCRVSTSSPSALLVEWGRRSILVRVAWCCVGVVVRQCQIHSALTVGAQAYGFEAHSPWWPFCPWFLSASVHLACGAPVCKVSIVAMVHVTRCPYSMVPWGHLFTVHGAHGPLVLWCAGAHIGVLVHQCP
ncbi:hypothetical protein CQW23_32990 [Capsicum baccatum]|uniref:Uncharacterized protein n=1 Tax=Capsicum baccatum TaxID=33114 RepID=A0A2G2V347_CAPBA|nr:hypothetical protein CQW23_32990 [Capsicum baccatum]